jgi:hypothetical protein
VTDCPQYQEDLAHLDSVDSPSIDDREAVRDADTASETNRSLSDPGSPSWSPSSTKSLEVEDSASRSPKQEDDEKSSAAWRAAELLRRINKERNLYTARRIMFKAMERMRWQRVEVQQCWVEPSGYPAMEIHYLAWALKLVESNPLMGQEALIARCMVVWSGFRQKLFKIGFVKWKDQKGREYYRDLEGYWTSEQELAEMGFCNHHEEEEEEEDFAGVDDEGEEFDWMPAPPNSPIPRDGEVFS